MNDSKARLLIAELVKSSVHHFLIAPGSRSSPLALAASENPLAKTTVHFDERGLAFMGVAISRATQTPVCLICTSGTALANFYPAIIEASMNHIPLIILAGDRPYELCDVGANQAIDHVHMFGSYLRFESDLSLADLPDAFIARTVNQAVFRAKNAPSGPVFLNIRFREPLITPGKRKPIYDDEPLPQTTYHLTEKALSTSITHLFSQEKGVIIVGNLPPSPYLDAILSLGKALQWPILADALSGLRSFGRDVIPFYNHLLQTSYANGKLIPDIVLYLGGHVISKTLLKWLSVVNPQTYIHVANFPERHDPNYQVTDRIECDPATFCKDLLPLIKPRSSPWLSAWQDHSRHIESVVTTFFEEKLILSEPHTVFSLLKLRPDASLFFGTSLPIRYADSLFFPKETSGPLFGNRGASGIDGLIASAIGTAVGTQRQTIAFLGDLSFLHDVNSLALAKSLDVPLTLVVINNGGGGIFQFLPVAEHPAFTDKFVATKHSWNMHHLAQSFSIPYCNPQSLDLYQQVLMKPGLQIIEVTTDAKENLKFHQSLEQYLKKKVIHGRYSLSQT